MNKNYIVPSFTALGVLVGGIVWLVIYSLNHTASSGFDGPAGLMLGLSMAASGFIFGMLSIIYAIRNKYISFLKAFVLFLVSGLLSGVLIGFFISNYAMSKYSDYHPIDAIPSADALMTLTSSGGYCAGPCEHVVYNLYESGEFESHTKLSNSEVAQLKDIINNTDFLKYGENPNPKCPSFVDGSDQVLLFPQKYGYKTFTLCMLGIPEDDPAFKFIEKLIKSHAIQD